MIALAKALYTYRVCVCVAFDPGFWSFSLVYIENASFPKLFYLDPKSIFFR